MKFRTLLATAALLAAPLLSHPVLAEFDPVHEDIDIFMANPAIESERPNVLIVLDTTANWESYFTSEKSALVSVVNGLTDQFNVGLMLFAGSSIEGSYMRYSIRQMTETNKSALSNLIYELSDGPSSSFAGDKTNNGVPGQAMVEAYRYFSGQASYSAGTSNAEHDPRTDYAGNATNSWITTLPGNAFPGAPAVASNYSSPVVDGCQRNFIIYISNGKGSNQIGEKTEAKNQLTSVQGSTASALALSPTGNESDSWFDEWASFFNKNGFTMTVDGASRTIYAQTYVVEINPGSQSTDLQWSATLKSGSRDHGGGKYFSTSDADPGAELTAALNDIFNEIKDVNSVFASTTLPVSVNVRGTNLNQVYIGMFRPDADKAPRWFGNLKMYKLALLNDKLRLVGANGVETESPTTGFIVDDAKSFWTHDSTFWSFRDDTENGAGEQSDSPDGDVVEKGAVAQQLRDIYATSQTARNLYTCNGSCNACTPGGSGTAQTCTNSSNLSATPFSTANANITAAALGLGTKDVSPLTAKVTKSVTSIVDRRNVSLNNATGTTSSVTDIENGAIVHAVTAATPFDSTKQMNTTGLTALTSSMQATAIAAKSSSGTSATLSFSTSGFTSNPCASKDYITVAGNDSSINGTWPITATGNTSSPSRYTVTFTVSGTASPNTQGTLYCSVKSTTATATVTALPSGLAVNSRINISGASPTAFNGNFLVTAVNAANSSFSYTIGSVQGLATAQGILKVYNTVNAGVYSPTSSTVRITVASPSNGYSATDTVTLTGITPSVYDGTVSVATATTNSFTYDFANATANSSWPFTDATAFGTTYKGATTTATVTVDSNTLFNTSPIDITGTGSSCFDTSGAIANWISSTQFTYTTSSACEPVVINPASSPQVNASGYGTTVTATLSSHGYVTGNNITIADGASDWHNGTFIVTGSTDSTFTYTNNNVGAPVAPSGQYTVRLTSNPLAYVTATAHGFSSGDSVTISGASPAGYNLTTTASAAPTAASNLMKIDDNTFTYPLASAPGMNSGMVIASKNTTTARAHSVAHGFADGSISISGATPNEFNGTFNIHSTGADDFIYCLNEPLHDFSLSATCASTGTTAGDASGSILATAGSGTNSERDQLIAWVRGANNARTTGHENTLAEETSCRATVHGDVLHSRPAVINYNRYGDDNDVYVFYGANDGVFRAVKGGNGEGAGEEAWGFVPTEGFSQLKRLRNNSPIMSSDFKKPYFMDGPIGLYSIDGDLSGDSKGKIESSSPNDHVYLYVGARRGGRYIYSLDVTDPVNPKYRWKIDNTTTGFGELGYTWSQPTVVTGIEGYVNPVLIFGGGYDPDVEDIENCTITAASSASVTYSKGTISYNTESIGCTVSGGVSTTVSRSMGRAIYVVDAITGELIWWAGPAGSGADLEVTGMDFAIPSDVTVVKNLSGGSTNRGYVGDTGGNLWRLDFGGGNTANWSVTKIASIADLTTFTGGYLTGYRKLTNPPDVVSDTGFDSVVVGTGDREHPFDNTVVNRFYMFKDHGSDAGPGTGTTYYLNDTNADGIGDTPAVLTRAGVANGSGNPVISHSPTTTDGQLLDVTTSKGSTEGLAATDGWFFTFGTGEKVIGNALALNGVIYFNTNQLNQTADSSCVANLGDAFQYKVGLATGINPAYQEGDNVTLASRRTEHPGGGFLPPPVHVVVQVPDEEGNMQTVEGVISGPKVQTPEQGAVGSRSRRFWYKEIDE